MYAYDPAVFTKMFHQPVHRLAVLSAAAAPADILLHESLVPDRICGIVLFAAPDPYCSSVGEGNGGKHAGDPVYPCDHGPAIGGNFRGARRGLYGLGYVAGCAGYGSVAAAGTAADKIPVAAPDKEGGRVDRGQSCGHLSCE